jgi:oxygen-independent coproporphyrinogen-3 oxidase
MPYSLYLHIPFCTHRCGYCDFNTYAGIEDLIPSYARALCAEITHAASTADKQLPVHSVFFGGGTPSLLPLVELDHILGTVAANYDLLPGVEITLEANPGTLSLEYLRDLRNLGVNRLSLGVQSAHPAELRLLERIHDYGDVTRSVSWARQAGFDNLNLDLIFGLPEQPLENWQHTLALALGLQPEHFSLYALSLEHGTPFGNWARRGLLSTPDPDAAADMYEHASEVLANSGYSQYEISNWARSRPLPAGPLSGRTEHGLGEGERLACRHNLQYWRNQPYLGFGAGAHGYANGVRTANVLSPAGYIERLAVSRQPLAFPWTPATQNATSVDRDAEIAETMMMGLRLIQEGVSDTAFQKRFGQSLGERFAAPIERFTRLGLLEWSGDRLRLTTRGRLLGNQVFVEFI